MRAILKKARLGVRQTRERERIMDLVHGLPGHFSAEQVARSLARPGPSISRATVYRTLDLMVDHGILQRVHLGERGSEYELAHGKPQHAHLYCLGCGRLEDYPMPELERLPARVRIQEGFQAAHLLMRICGYCQQCRGGRARTSPKKKRRN